MEEINALSQWLSEPLLEWYDQSHRILPWRSEPTPYRVWISEIMLQQTRVETVKEYFIRFMNAFPTIEKLANAEEENVLKMWEGLGYYSRARNLLVAAKQIMNQYHGEMPSTKAELMKLKGIGSYTAGAISAFAFNKNEVAVDGNVLRVIARLTASERDILLDTTKKQMEVELAKVLPQGRPGDFGQAMIELGAMICIPGMPRCQECPLRGICMGRIMGRETNLPIRVNKTKKREENRTVLIIQCQDLFLVEKRENHGLLAGLYQFPNLFGHLSEEEVLSYIQKEYLLLPYSCQRLSESKHVFSHLVWNMIGYSIQVKNNHTNGLLWVGLSELEDKIAIPSAFHKYHPLESKKND